MKNSKLETYLSTPHLPIPQGYKIIVLPEEEPQTDDFLFADLPDVMTCKEASKALSICEKTLRELAIKEEIKGFKVGKVWRFTRKSLTDFVEGGGYEHV